MALQMFTTFLTSGATDVDKMLYIFHRDGNYFVAFHEFVKSIMLGERRYYKEAHSPVMNVFDCGTQKNSSHFTSLRILRFLLHRRAEWSREGQGYCELAQVAAVFEDIFDNREDLIRSMNRLVERQLVETNTRSTDTILGASHVRATSAAWYYFRYLVPSFSYLDLVLQDTPLNSLGLMKELEASVYKVDNLGDKEDEKIARMETRFLRVEKFLSYLQDQENFENQHFEIARIKSDITEPLVPDITERYKEQKAWIEKRIRENREKYGEEKLFEISGEEEFDRTEEDEKADE